MSGLSKTRIFILSCCIAAFSFANSPAAASRVMEKLDRGVVAVYVSGDVFVSWRMFGTDPSGIGFNVYRDSVLLNASPITDSTNYLDALGTLSSTYTIVPVINGIEQTASEPVTVWSSQYLEIPLNVPAGVTTPDGGTCTYSPNDASVGDLDGDGQYEIVLKWDPSNSHDNSERGYTGNVYLDAYELDGTQLWRIDLGINIRAGAHYTQFIVYDLDSDGLAEVACRTAPYTVDGRGNYILMPGDTLTDYRESDGLILTGPEYLTIFDGMTGEELVTTDFYPNRGSSVNEWGDNYGNRCDRFLAGVAYVDGQKPTLIMARGYYRPKSGYSARNEIVAYNWRDDTLSQVWYFAASTNEPNSDYIGQGCHSLSIADVDNDGKDEIVYGSCAIDDDGTGLYTTGLGHGDALHVSDMDPAHDGLEVWMCHEDSPYGVSFRDAETGAIIFRDTTPTEDTGRACAGDITADYPGYELWATGGVDLYSCDGTQIGSRPSPVNFMVYWDGDLLREFLNGTTISKYGSGTLLSAAGCESNNTTKATPCLSADILGDWREEVILRTSDNAHLRIFTTTDYTENRIYTLMHDCQYREAIAWQNSAYNQPPHPSFFLGHGMSTPPTPDIILVGPDELYGDFDDDLIVYTQDLSYFADSLWLQNVCESAPNLDLNGDCIVNLYEFAEMAANWTGPDMTPPRTPLGLTAVAANGSVSLDWADNIDSDLEGYNLYRSTVSGYGYAKINTTSIADSEYTDDDVINDTTYYYAVTAVDTSSNESDISSQVSATPSEILTVTIQENETGFVGVFDGSVDSNNAGFTGSGFANTDNAVGNYIEWTIDVPQTGLYDLQWRFANGGSSNRSGLVSINGFAEPTSVDLDSTGDWTVWQESSIETVTLTQGTNTIRLIAETSDGLANIDWIKIVGIF